MEIDGVGEPDASGAPAKSTLLTLEHAGTSSKTTIQSAPIR